MKKMLILNSCGVLFVFVLVEFVILHPESLFIKKRNHKLVPVLPEELKIQI